MMEPWTAVLMDLDQTLIDSRESILESFRHALAAMLDRDQLAAKLGAMWGRPLRDQMAELAGEEHADRLVEAYRQHLWTLDHLVTLYEGLPAVLEELRARGYRLGIVTSKGRAATDRHMALFGLDRVVEVTITADDSVRHKPDPLPFLMAAESLAVPPRRCLVVGDSPWDIVAATRAGMVAALAEWGGFDPAAFELNGASPTFRLSRPQQLLDLCPPLGGSAADSDTGE